MALAASARTAPSLCLGGVSKCEADRVRQQKTAWHSRDSLVWIPSLKKGAWEEGRVPIHDPIPMNK
jgi:hypothetical protein